MRLLRILLLLLLPIALLTSCGDDDDDTVANDSADVTTTTAGSSSDDAADHELTYDDNNSDLTIAVGETIAVSLESCPSCGYQWLVGGDGADTLSLESESDSNPTAGAGQTGGNVTHRVVYKGVAPGEVVIDIGYYGPGKDAPDEVFTVNVTVEA
jgi:predicted secreted protein